MNFLLTFLIFLALALGQEEDNDALAPGSDDQTEQQLPYGVYLADNRTWMVTVPTVWNYTTILIATNRSYILYPDESSVITSKDLPFPSLYPWDVQIVFVNGSYSRYASNAINYAATANFNATWDDYSDETWALPVVCEWPISGMYSLLNRILFYVLLVFSLVVHHHEWLVAGALASATTYSGAAAVQAWAQYGVVRQFGYTVGDNDNEAIMAILSASLLLAVPLINWSRTLRRLQARPILIYWALIVFSGYLLVIIADKQTQSTNGWRPTGQNIMTCATRRRLPSFKNFGFIDHDFIVNNNCNDPCYSAGRTHPFHDPTSAIARLDCLSFTWTTLTADFSCFTQCPRSIASNCGLGKDGYTKLDFKLNNVAYYFVLPVAIAELFFVLCFGRMSPEDIRDYMFRKFMGGTTMTRYRQLPPSKRRGVPITWGVGFAQTGAMIFYVLAVLTYLVCIPFFVFSVAWLEHLLVYTPDAEEVWEAGQWLPWVVVALTLGAAIVGKYHHHARVWLLHLFSGKPKEHTQPVVRSVERSKVLLGWIQRKSWRTLSRLRLEWRALQNFITHPFWQVLDDTTERTSDHPTVKYAFRGAVPYPDRDERHNEDNYQGPWIRSSTWNDFDVEFFVQADDRTLRSWERFQHKSQHQQSTNEHIVYEVHLPPVPHYPDHRTVVADVSDTTVTETIALADPQAPKNPYDPSEAISPATRRRSTVTYVLQDTGPAADASRRSKKSQGSANSALRNGPKQASATATHVNDDNGSSFISWDPPTLDPIDGTFWNGSQVELSVLEAAHVLPKTDSSAEAETKTAEPRRSPVASSVNASAASSRVVSQAETIDEPNVSQYDADQPLLRRSSTGSDDNA